MDKDLREKCKALAEELREFSKTLDCNNLKDSELFYTVNHTINKLNSIESWCIAYSPEGK